jgi:hypothetical protein
MSAWLPPKGKRKGVYLIMKNFRRKIKFLMAHNKNTGNAADRIRRYLLLLDKGFRFHDQRAAAEKRMAVRAGD